MSRIFPLFALIIAIVLFFAYINPTWTGSIAATQASIAADTQALAAADQYASQQNQLAAARDAIDPNSLTALNTFLPTSVDNVGLILDVNTLATHSALSISDVNVVTGDTGSVQNTNALPASGNPVGSVDLSLSAVGTLASLQAFLVGIENSARLLDVHDLTITGSNTGVYTYHMIIRLYWLQS
jgi:Tfp pilus assembly protein PilO